MSQNSFCVIGAGVSGLTAALAISKNYPTVVIDRLPMFGGTHANYENEFAISLMHKCNESGVKFMLGNTALRWNLNNQLLIAGPDGIRWLPGQHLVYAGGIRPSTQAELGVLGQRLGGVLPCTVAKHFLESGVRLGNRVVILGYGNSARQIIRELSKQGSQIIVLPMDEFEYPAQFIDEWWPGWNPLSIHGDGRVSEIKVHKDGMEENIRCDAVIFAARMKPLRNIDGAIFEHESSHVTFVQMVSDTSTLEQRSAYASKITLDSLLALRR